MTEISIIQNFNKVIANKAFHIVAEQIKAGTFKSQVEELQKLLESGKDKEYKKKKKSLLAFTPSGRFEGGRKPEFLKKYSRIIILDIDKIDNLTIVKEKAIQCKYTYCCFVSPSNKGLKLLVKTDNSSAKHTEAFS